MLDRAITDSVHRHLQSCLVCFEHKGIHFFLGVVQCAKTVRIIRVRLRKGRSARTEVAVQQDAPSDAGQAQPDYHVYVHRLVIEHQTQSHPGHNHKQIGDGYVLADAPTLQRVQGTQPN